MSVSCTCRTRKTDVPMVERGVVPSGVLQVDFDGHGDPHLDSSQIEDVRERIQTLPSCVFVFTSPSGDGLKAGIRIDGAGDPERHASVFRRADVWIRREFGIGNDPAVKDVQRLCFLSWDPDAFYNPAAVPLDLPEEPATDKTQEECSEDELHDDDPSADAAKVEIALGHLDADMSRADWIRVGMALHSWDPLHGLVLWTQWSSQSKKGKFKEGQCEREWASFHAEGGITVATLFKMAMKAGWNPPGRGDGWPLRDPMEAARQGKPVMCTDLGNAERFAFRNQGKVRYAGGLGWCVWDGRRWAKDENGGVARRAFATVRAIYREAEVAPRPQDSNTLDLPKLLSAHARASEDKRRLDAMLTLAQSMPGIATPTAEFDADPFLLNCLNGTLDLRTGVLRPHNPTDMITMLAPVNYDPRMEGSEEWYRWLKFLHDATGGNSEVVAFLRRALGYSLTGDISEEVLFFIHGLENTGKTTFLEAGKKALGDYAVTANFEMLVKKQHGDGGPRNDIARLAGKRLVASSEVADGKQLAEEIVKSLTGNEGITARFLHREYFEFDPQFKLWLAANHAPKVSAEDGAMWRRILRIPFDKVVPKNKRDRTLKAMLKDPKRGGPVVLLWAVKGCLEWQQQGLAVPEVVTRATEAYRAECDPLKDFVVDRCEIGPSLFVESNRLRLEYDLWSAENGVSLRYRLGPRVFADNLRARGCTPARGTGGVRLWHGIGLSEASGGKPRVTPVTHSGGNSPNPPCNARAKGFTGTGVTGVTMRHSPSEDASSIEEVRTSHVDRHDEIPELF